MGFHQKFIAFLFTASLILCITSLVKALRDEENPLETKQETCSTDDLNKSVLVEISAKTKPIHTRWPDSSEEVLHIYTTRAGERLTLETSQNLNYDEPENERLLNINTTLYLKTKRSKSIRDLRGFGTTINTKSIVESSETCSFKTNIIPVLIDLVQINFSLFKIKISRHSLLNHNAEKIIQELNVVASNGGKTLRLILNFEEIEDSPRTLAAMNSFSAVLEASQSLLCYSFSSDLDVYDLFRDLKGLCGGRNIEINLEETDAKEISSVLDHMNRTSQQQVLMLKSSNLYSYDIIEYTRNLLDGGDLIVVSRNKPRIRKFGDWQNAQNLAVEVLNHLKHGANGFLENVSFVSPFRDQYPEDCSIYNLRPDLDQHYRSPMFYAMAHFSLYLPVGSELLDSDLFTQPNMFAAHYIGFRTPQNHTVVIVLNDNEHQLLFRLAVDGRIVTSHSLKPKSFNTFIIKQ